MTSSTFVLPSSGNHFFTTVDAPDASSREDVLEAADDAGTAAVTVRYREGPRKVCWFEYTKREGLIIRRTFSNISELEAEIAQTGMFYTTSPEELSYPADLWLCFLCKEIIKHQAKSAARHCNTCKHTKRLSEHTGLELEKAGHRCPICGAGLRDDLYAKHVERCEKRKEQDRLYVERKRHSPPPSRNTRHYPAIGSHTRMRRNVTVRVPEATQGPEDASGSASSSHLPMPLAPFPSRFESTIPDTSAFPMMDLFSDRDIGSFSWPSSFTPIPSTHMGYDTQRDHSLIPGPHWQPDEGLFVPSLLPSDDYHHDTLPPSMLDFQHNWATLPTLPNPQEFNQYFPDADPTYPLQSLYPAASCSSSLPTGQKWDQSFARAW